MDEKTRKSIASLSEDQKDEIRLASRQYKEGIITEAEFRAERDRIISKTKKRLASEPSATSSKKKGKTMAAIIAVVGLILIVSAIGSGLKKNAQEEKVGENKETSVDLRDFSEPEPEELTIQETESPQSETSSSPASSASPASSETKASSSSVAPVSSETVGQKNAVKSAKSYLSYTAFSRDGLIAQLEFEKYSREDAVYAVDKVDADWNEQAAKSARSYLDYTSFSRQGLIDQLVFEKFTHEQAVYGVNAVGL